MLFKIKTLHNFCVYRYLELKLTYTSFKFIDRYLELNVIQVLQS